MKSSICGRPWVRLAAGALAWPLVGLLALGAPTTTQSLTLLPGWNAVNFEVLPADADPGVVFNGVDVDSVWTYENRLGSPEFIQEVTEQTLAKSGWFSWVPSTRVDAFQNTLFRIQVNHAYLVKFNGAAPVTLALSGRPARRDGAWQPDTFNFRGLPVDPAAPPTFLNFFRLSPAHYAAATGLQPIYRLDGAGSWARVAPSDLIESGRGYWIYCQGGSDYVAPLGVKSSLGDGLEFSTVANDLGLDLKNPSTASVNVTVRDLGSPAPNPLSYAERLANASLTWPALPSPLVRSVAPGVVSRERIAVRRTDMTADLFETVLEITDGVGTRFLVPVSAERTPVTGGGSSVVAARSGRTGARPAAGAEAISHAGLWSGTATLSAVSEAHSGPLTTNLSQGFTIVLETNIVSRIVTTNKVPNAVFRQDVSMAPTPTGSEFNLRLLLHVDATGQTRLLKEVIQMWREGTTRIDGNGDTVVDRPGETVLITDDTKVGLFSGIRKRDGVPVGRRLSTVGFDFAGDDLPLAGDFAIGFAVIGTNTMSASFARNPFKHRYHSDHQQGYDIKRVIRLELAPPPPNPPPGYGERVLDGTYYETVSGLHQTNIVVSGTFRLNRLDTTATLNPQP